MRPAAAVLACWMVFVPPASSQEATTPPVPAAPSPPPYSLPWLLRPAAAATVLRLDTTVAAFETPSGAGAHTLVESVTASWKAGPQWAPLARVSWVRHDPGSSGGETAHTFSNPLVGVSYVRPLTGGSRLSLFGASTIPVGGGGGARPDPGDAAAMARAIPARSAMDNALFAVNYWTVVGGAGIARVTRGATLQAEATLLQLTRVRGPETQDASRTNFTAGLHAGRFLGPRLSISAELRMQRWLSDAAPVRTDAAARDTLTASVGPRLHFKLGRRWIRPGLAYTRALDDPLDGQGYDIVQLDVPIAF